MCKSRRSPNTDRKYRWAEHTPHARDEDALDAAIIQRVLDDSDQELVPLEPAKRIATALNLTVDDLI